MGTSPNVQLAEYDKYIVAFSGGKDSIASFLHLLDIGIPRDKIELWHHDIDGLGSTFMDWECTPGYCRAFAKAFGVTIYFSWREGGFKKEMLRDNTPTARTWFEVPGKEKLRVVGGKGPKGTRLKFPQVSADLSVRWCSAYLKIDVGTIAIKNQERFNNIRTLVISGERGEESVARAKYAILEPDRADLRNGKKISRWVDRWRPVRDWKEQQVWEIIERYKIRVHPAYYLGWGRVSCKFCIFGNANQFASAFAISPVQGKQIAAYETNFDCTIKRKESVYDLVRKGKPYEGLKDNNLISQATSNGYTEEIFMEDWILPLGAYGESCGPT